MKYFFIECIGFIVRIKLVIERIIRSFKYDFFRGGFINDKFMDFWKLFVKFYVYK